MQEEGLTAWPIPVGPEFIHGSNSILAVSSTSPTDKAIIAMPTQLFPPDPLPALFNNSMCQKKR